MTPRHLYLHIGWPMTDTTALQVMYANNPNLLARHGLAYNRVMVTSGHPGATGSGDLFTPATVAAIHQRYATSNEAVRQQYFPGRTVLFGPELPLQTDDVPPSSDGLCDLLIATIAEMRGADVADQAQRALMGD